MTGSTVRAKAEHGNSSVSAELSFVDAFAHGISSDGDNTH